MLETLWPRLRTGVRLLAFGVGLAVMTAAVWSILQQPLALDAPGQESAGVVAVELLAIVGAAMWMLLVTKL